MYTLSKSSISKLLYHIQWNEYMKLISCGGVIFISYCLIKCTYVLKIVFSNSCRYICSIS